MGPCRTLGAGRRVLHALEPAGRGFPRTAQGPQLRDAIRRSWEAQHRVYSPRRVWRQRRREGQRVVARCTVERLTAEMGLRGATRGRVDHDDAIGAGHGAARGPGRAFTATGPNQLGVSDLTYMTTWRGFVYVAFVIDVFARRIVGWRVSTFTHRLRARRPGAGDL